MFNKFWKPDRMVVACHGNSQVRGQNVGHTFQIIGQ